MEVSKIAVASVFYLVVFVLIELVSRKFSLHKELTRKSAHIIAGVTAAFLPEFMSMQSVQVLALLFVVVMVLSKKKSIFRSVHNVKRSTYGEFLFPLGVFLAALFFQGNQDAYTYSLLVLGLSDGFASLVGQRFGKHKIRIGAAAKTLEGSLTFMIITLIIGLFFTEMSAQGLLFAALASTVVEAVCPWGTDNAVLPPVVGLLFLVA